jgi:hypothetical protein
MTDEMSYTNANYGNWLQALREMERDPSPTALSLSVAPVQVAESTMDDIDRLFFDLRKLKTDYAEACADRDRARLAEARVGELAGEIERKILELQQAVRGVTP